MSLAHDATRSHVDGQDLGHNLLPYRYLRAMLLLGPGRSGWPVLSSVAMVLSKQVLLPRALSGYMALPQPRSVLMSLAPETVEDCADAQDLGHNLWP